jgi:hypothetical protein
VFNEILTIINGLIHNYLLIYHYHLRMNARNTEFCGDCSQIDNWIPIKVISISLNWSSRMERVMMDAFLTLLLFLAPIKRPLLPFGGHYDFGERFNEVYQHMPLYGVPTCSFI